MGNFAENLNLGNRVRPPGLESLYTLNMSCIVWQQTEIVSIQTEEVGKAQFNLATTTNAIVACNRYT